MDVEGMSLCRIVDRFQTVLAEFVGAIFKAEPKTMLAAGAKEVRAEDVLSCESPDDFRQRDVVNSTTTLDGHDAEFSQKSSQEFRRRHFCVITSLGTR